MIDNDTQSVIGTDLAPMGLTPNEKGYTLIGEVWSLEEALDTKDSWSLALLSSSPYMPTLTSSKDGALATSFSVNETKKYYLPNRDYHMLRLLLNVYVHPNRISLFSFKFFEKPCYTLICVL